MRWIKRLGTVVIVALVISAALGLHYILPKHDVVHVTGVEVKRVDDDGVVNAENPAEGPTRDMYFINTADPDSNKVRVYRNEDTGWGFPWYFKFDSADVQARAQDFSRNSNQLALIRYYGWRLQMFSTFPNITDIEATTTRDEPLPIFNILFFLVVGGVIMAVFLATRRRSQRRLDRPI